MRALLVVVLLVFQLAAAEEAALQTRWLLFRATHHNRRVAAVELLRDEPRPGATWARQAPQSLPASGDHQLRVFAEGGASTALHSLHDLGPGVAFHDSASAANSWAGGAVRTNVSYVEVRVESTVTRLHFAQHAFQRSFSTQATAAPTAAPDPELSARRRNLTISPIQDINTKKLPTVVFLAAGYTLASKEDFEWDVSRCIATLRESTDALRSDPWPRYFSFLNIFSIFEPSAESGASRPVGPDHVCPDSGECGPDEVNNNLDCAYGTPDPNRLGCSHEKVLELGSFVPPAEIYIVIVNDGQYGGTGGQKIATINNGADMATLLLHEVNHAFASLADEYSYGFESGGSESLPNCDSTNQQEDIKWRGWIDSPKPAVDLVPSRGCMFSNYYRPTESKCLMHARHSEMCAVCREQVVKTLYTPVTTNISDTRMHLSKPRCPPEGIEIYLEDEEAATLTINHRFALYNKNVSVVWELPNGDRYEGLSAVTIPGHQLERGPNVVTVRISDGTDFVLSTNPSMTHVATFPMRRRDNASNCQPMTCTTSNNIPYTYCGSCILPTRENPDPEQCERSAKILPYTKKSTTTSDLDEASSTVMIVAIIIGCIGLALLILALVGHKLHQALRPCELLLLTSGDQVVRVLSAVGSVLVLIIGCALIVLCVKYLPRAVIFGDSIYQGVLAVSCIIYLAAVLKFCSVIAKWSSTLIASAIVVALMGVCLFGISTFGIFVAVNSDSREMVERYDKLWIENVEDHPDRVCTLQSALECSGLHHSCVPIPTKAYCPNNCDEENRNKNACLDVWQEFVKDTVQPVAIIGLVCSFVMVLAAIADILFFVRLTRQRDSQRGRRSYRKDVHAPVRALTMDELQIARREFIKADDNGDELLQGEEVIRFLRAVFREEPDAEDTERIMKAGDLDFEAFVEIYFPSLDRKKTDPRQLTIREAEDAGDVVELQQQQFAKLEHYMEASATLSPEVLNTIYTRFARFEYDDDQQFVDVVAAAAQEHASSVEHDMLRGLTFHELEGLRNAWCTIHPTINGALTDREIDRLYQMTHDEPLVSQEHFVKWKRLLDVRRTGTIGWAEFAYPFAQRALLRKAKEDLRSHGRMVEHELLDRGRVLEEFGVGPADQVFLPFETQVPVERVVALSLEEDK